MCVEVTVVSARGESIHVLVDELMLAARAGVVQEPSVDELPTCSASVG